MSKAEKSVYVMILFSTAIGIGITADYKYNNGKAVKSVGDYSKSAGKISAAAAGIFDDFFKSAPPVINNPTANASVTATPQVTETPAPSYDYYDKDFKVGIVIEGDDGFKRNVTNMLNTMKEVTPKRYAEVIPYAPKKIVRSSDSYSWQGDDFIELPKQVDQAGGSDGMNSKLFGTADLYGEMRNLKRDKTGVQFTNVYDRVMDDAKGFASYNTETKLWTQKQADDYLKSVSEGLKSGKIWKGTQVEKNMQN